MYLLYRMVKEDGEMDLRNPCLRARDVVLLCLVPPPERDALSAF